MVPGTGSERRGAAGQDLKQDLVACADSSCVLWLQSKLGQTGPIHLRVYFLVQLVHKQLNA